MPTAAGLITSTILGAVARRIQVLIVGKQYPRSWSRIQGYGLSTGLFVGGYLVIDNYIDRNRDLLNRRLQVLRDQRAQDNVFYELDPEADHRITASKRTGKLYDLLDRYGKSYK